MSMQLRSPIAGKALVTGASGFVGGHLRDEVDSTTDEARWIPLGEVAGLPRVPLVDAALALWRIARQ